VWRACEGGIEMDLLTLCVILLFSTLAGIILSTLGIGTAVILVPFRTFVIGIPIKVAITTSLVDSITVSDASFYCLY
jgi:uncharacterized membrane protein YfcA